MSVFGFARFADLSHPSSTLCITSPVTVGRLSPDHNFGRPHGRNNTTKRNIITPQNGSNPGRCFYTAHRFNHTKHVELQH
jgi:hypothetical protein